MFADVGESVEVPLRQQMMRPREADRVLEGAVVFEKVTPMPAGAFVAGAVISPG